MQLNYKTFGEGFPVVILHGLLGSLDNWQTIAKQLSGFLFQVFIVDQRNHGRSPHTDEFNYELLSNDLLEFFVQQKIEKAHLIGHSMGGKVVMKFALEHPEKVGKLIVVDIAPAVYEENYSVVFNALFAADIKNTDSREEVEKRLREKLSENEATVQFLLKGLSRDENGKYFEWKFNLDSLSKNYNRISDAEYKANPFKGNVLFIKGEKSSYINPDNYSSITRFFPHHQLTEIKGAAHWVHAEKPKEFLEEVIRFLK
jgi:pimeloyl-ACP methyl ester carboxylesterase